MEDIPTPNQDNDVQERGDAVSPRDSYYGYQPLVADDFDGTPGEQYSRSESLCSVNRQEAREEEEATGAWRVLSPQRTQNNFNSCTTFLVAGFITCFALSVVFLTLAVLGARCKLGMCSKIDRSSMQNDDYNFEVFNFAAPFQYILASLCVSTMCACAIFVLAYLVMHQNIGTLHMLEVASYIRNGSQSFLLQEYTVAIPTVVIFFVLTWLATNGRVAGCYAVGALVAILSASFGVSFATQANIRTAAAAQESFDLSVKVAFRSGAVVGLTVLSLGLGGLSLCYLIFRDIHALAGFSAGASTIALFARVAGGMLKRAANIGTTLAANTAENMPGDDPRNSGTIADKIGKCVGDVAGLGSDFFESYVASIVAASILGSFLPYYMDNPYALCVYNHLYIDETCVMFAKPTYKLSFAGQICKTDNFYEAYPSLSMSQSNSLLVAFPFLIGILGMLASVLCSAYIYVPKRSQTATKEDQQNALTNLLWSVKGNLIALSTLVIVGTAILCWGMFGSASSFQKGLRGDDGKGFPRYELTGTDADGRCKPLSLTVGQSGGILPQGEELERPYRPIDSFGNELPPVSSLPWRLFLCVTLGLLLGTSVASLAEYTTASHFARKGMRSSIEHGASERLIQGLGVGMLSTVLPLFLVMATILGTHELLGSYGVALAAVGILSPLGLSMAASSCRAIADNAHGISSIAGTVISSRDILTVLANFGNAMIGTGEGLASGSAILTSYAVLAVMIQETLLAPSPRELVGFVTGQNPTRHITDADDFMLTEPKVIAATFIGVLLPYVYGGSIILAVSRVGRELCNELTVQFRKLSEPHDASEAQRVTDHEYRIRRLTRSVLLEMIVPGLTATLSSLIIGYSLGQRALIGMLMGAIGSGFLLGSFMSNSEGSWESAREFAGLDTADGNTKMRSQPHSGSTVNALAGSPLKDTCGTSMNILIKMTCAYGLIAVSTMRREQSFWWIGLILFFVYMAISCTMHGINIRRARRAKRQLLDIAATTTEMAEGNQNASKIRRLTAQSPFQEAGPGISHARVAPGSQNARELLALDGEQGRGAQALASFSWAHI